MKVELTKSQLWLVTRSLLWLTSDDGADAIYSEYPSVDIEALGRDVGELLEKLRAVACDATQGEEK